MFSGGKDNELSGFSAVRGKKSEDNILEMSSSLYFKRSYHYGIPS
jgi:hypothetical protein